jgi:hypothetical protein
LVTILNFMIIEVMSIFIVYELVNISLCADCDNLLAPKKDLRRFSSTDQNTQIFNAFILVALCPVSIKTEQ